jgi:hypothetical protein
VGATRACGNHPAITFSILELDLPTATGQKLADPVRRPVRRFGERCLGALAEGLQALGPDAFLHGLQVAQDVGRVARDAQRGADHQEQQISRNHQAL